MSLIPSQFPPIGLFDTVATAAHLSTVMELIAWTNDRLVADPIDRLPQREWVYGVPKAGIVMAAFGGMRFNGPEFGTEGLVRRRLYPDRSCRCRGRSPPAARDGRLQRSYDDPDCRAYTATLLGDYLDIRGQQSTRSDVYASERYVIRHANSGSRLTH
jgi:hypothetical protein